MRRLLGTNLIRLEGAICVQKGTPMFAGFMHAADVVHHSKVDTYDPDTKTGYQRAASPTRIRRASVYYEKGGRMPNPLLVNIREDDFDQVHVVITSANRDGYELAITTGDNWIGTGYIEFSRDLAIWVFDGQHREGGWRRLVTDALNDRYGSFPIPISLTLGLSSAEEMKEFYEVNTNAEAVKTDLAWELLRQMAAEDPALSELLEESDKTWITRGIEITTLLDNGDGPWHGRIQSPNEKKQRGDSLIIPQAQFVRSLKPVLDMPLLKRAEPATIVSIVNAYWRGIAQVLPEPFEAPASFVIQKGQGATALHRVLPQAIEVVRARRGRLADPTAYADVMRYLPTLSGQTYTEDGGQVTQSGADFWRVGSVASGFNGDSGRRRLGIYIQALLPKPAEEIAL
jgi:DGQHR domain-containing protein